MELVLPTVSRVAVCGGTHGSELSGVYLIDTLGFFSQRRRNVLHTCDVHSLRPSLNEEYSLESVGKHGLVMIEIGPQAHRVVGSNMLSAKQEGVQHILEWIRLFNSGRQFEGGKVEVYTMTHSITASIRPQLQDRDFCLLHPYDPLFQISSGETQKYQGTEPLYPFFMNECAYYEKGIALSLARQRSVGIPSIWLESEREQGKRKSVPEERGGRNLRRKRRWRTKAIRS
uniref:AstE/AspA barrel-sandwich hybrid domain-containing protein n=1 Tax=Hucho hucho TaxID=62062 RepID=A0A4W5LPX4_9TELE